MSLRDENRAWNSNFRLEELEPRRLLSATPVDAVLDGEVEADLTNAPVEVNVIETAAPGDPGAAVSVDIQPEVDVDVLAEIVDSDSATVADVFADEETVSPEVLDDFMAVVETDDPVPAPVATDEELVPGEADLDEGVPIAAEVEPVVGDEPATDQLVEVGEKSSAGTDGTAPISDVISEESNTDVSGGGSGASDVDEVPVAADDDVGEGTSDGETGEVTDEEEVEVEPTDEPEVPVDPPYVPPTFYSIDGSGNNVDNLDWGQANTQLRRAADVDYADGLAEPSGAERPSPRAVSNAVSAQVGLVPNARGLSDYVWQWGQFIDHDIGLTEPGESEVLEISVPEGDPQFDPSGTGTAVISTHRSQFDEATGDSVESPRQQINQITAFIDGSMIYGSDEDRATALREFAGGRLVMDEEGYLPTNSAGLANANPVHADEDQLYLAGDVRANEQAGLTSLHTLFVREHNRIADELTAADPDLSDEDAFQSARRQVIGLLQSITYREFLPALLGEDAIGEYSGYDETVNPQLANVFSTAAFRFGHSMVSGSLLQTYDDVDTADHQLRVRDAFFNPKVFHDGAMTPTLRGLAYQTAQEIDTYVVDDLRNFLFGPPEAGGLDLVSLNIARGRDHGLPAFNEARVDLGLEPISSFDELTSDQAVQRGLAETYGHIDNVDVWVGALAEEHVDGSSVGEFVQTVLVDQFARLRDGDRFWHESTLTADELEALRNTTLADVIERNTDITDLPGDVFTSHAKDDFADSAERATNLAVDGSRSGVLEQAGDQDWFVLQADAGDTLSIKTTLGSLDDSTLTVTDSVGEEIAFNDDTLFGLDSAITFEAPTSDTYFVKVAGFDDSVGSYEVSVRELHRHGNSPDVATEIFAGTTTRGAIDRFGASEWFQFDVEAGDGFVLETRLLSLPDSVLRLYDSEFNEVAAGDDSGQSFASRIELVADASTTYYASVNAFSGFQQGGYQLQLSEA